MAAPKKKAEPEAPKDEKSEAPKAKRTVLSPEEKIAKLEAEVAAVREKQASKNAKRKDEATDERAKLQAKVDELRKKIAELDKEIEGLTPGGASEPMTPDAASDEIHGAES